MGLRVPTNQVHGDGMPSLIASAMEDYKDKQWYAFGTQLGAAMQELVVTTFPTKYEVDDLGKLKRIYDASDLGQTRAFVHPSATLTNLLYAAVSSAALLICAALVRNRQKLQQRLAGETDQY